MTDVSAEPAPLQTPPLRVDGQLAVVTGAGRGIGLGCGLALAQAGADVVLVSRTREELERAAERVRATGGRAEVMVCDVSDAGQVAATIGGL